MLATLCLCAPRPVVATATGDSTIGFSGLSIAPATGSLTLDDVWLLQAFASANNSLGENVSNFNFSFSPDITSASAAVTWATAIGGAAALDDPPDLDVSANAMSNVNIPGCNLAAAFSESFGELSDSFTIDGTGSVPVLFSANVRGVLNVMTDNCGLEAFTQTIFTLEVDGGNPILFDQRVLDVGPSMSQMLAFDVTLTGAAMLDAGVSHFVDMQVSSETHAQTQAPEPPSAALLLAGLAMLLCVNRRRSASSITKPPVPGDQ